MKHARLLANIVVIAIFPLIALAALVATVYNGDLSWFFADMRARAEGIGAILWYSLSPLSSTFAFFVWVAIPFAVGIMVHEVKMALTPGHHGRSSFVSILATVCMGLLVFVMDDGADVLIFITLALVMAVATQAAAKRAQGFPTKGVVGLVGTATLVGMALLLSL